MVEREFLKISRRTTFQNILMTVTEFLTNSENAEIPQATVLVVSPHDALIAILKILGKLARNICDGVSFQYS